MKKISCFLLFFLLLLCGIHGQNRAQLRLIGAAVGDSVVLRWAVANDDAWPRANIAGYLLQRTELDAQNKVVGRTLRRMTQDTIRPWTFASLEKKINRQDTFALLAAQCLYGKSMRTKTLSGDLIAALKEADSELSNRHGFALIAADLSAQAADILGWRWVDRDIKKGHKYLYLLHCPRLNGQAMSDTAMYMIKPEEYLSLKAPEPPVLISSEGHISLTWEKQPQFSAYYPERSTDGIHFQRLTEKPYMEWIPRDRPNRDSMSFVDSVGVNYKRFYYRLVGINPFAQLSPPSQMVAGMAVDRTPPPAPEDIQLENIGEGQVKLHWINPPNTEPVLGLVIGKTPEPSTPVIRINATLLPPGTTEFTDEFAWQFGTNFYTVGLVDTAGNIGWSSLLYVVMEDYAPPAQPSGLQGSIDTAGLVKLWWNLGADFDLKGYNLYAANQADHVFIPLADTLITDTVFQYRIDLNNLTERIYFKIKAFDQNLKESVASEVLELKKPDIVPPDAPVFDDYKVTEQAVYLHWRPASSSDVAAQRLLRRSAGNAWATLATLPIEARSWTDTLLSAGQTWEYAIQAVDDAGLLSEPSFPVGVKIPASAKRRSVSGLKAVWDEAKNQVQLTWQSDAVCDHLLIYRADADNGLELWAKVPGNTLSFSDKPPRAGKFTYALKPLYAGGGEGFLSKEAVVETGK